jgi:LPXTG-motif cell wall-anchored protein
MAATGANKMNIFYIIGVVVVIIVIAGYLGLHV